jgi:hypothetical protein
MKHLDISLVYLGFFTLIGAAIYFTNSAYCLWALVLMPAISINSTETENESKRDTKSGDI